MYCGLTGVIANILQVSGKLLPSPLFFMGVMAVLSYPAYWIWNNRLWSRISSDFVPTASDIEILKALSHLHDGAIEDFVGSEAQLMPAPAVPLPLLIAATSGLVEITVQAMHDLTTLGYVVKESGAWPSDIDAEDLEFIRHDGKRAHVWLADEPFPVHKGEVDGQPIDFDDDPWEGVTLLYSVTPSGRHLLRQYE